MGLANRVLPDVSYVVPATSPPAGALVPASPPTALNDPAAFLASCEIFCRLGAEELAVAIALSQTRRCARGEMVYRQGAVAGAVYAVRRGQVKLARVSEDGREVIVWAHGLGEVFGGVGLGVASGSGTCYPSTATATTATTLLWWKRAVLLHHLPQLREGLGELAGERLREMEQRFCEMATQPIVRRLAKAVLRLQDAEGKVWLSREELAQHVGTTLCTVSRAVAGWGRRGWLEVPARGVMRVRGGGGGEGERELLEEARTGGAVRGGRDGKGGEGKVSAGRGRV